VLGGFLPQLLTVPLPLETGGLSAVYFLVAALILDAFDLSMPRGDSVGGAGVLWSTALIILGPTTTIVLALTSAVLAHALRRGSTSFRRLTTVVVSRIVALSVATLAFHFVSGRPASWAAFTIVPAVFLLTELAASQVVSAVWTGRSLLRLIRGNLYSRAPLIVAQWSTAVLLLLTYAGMSDWALVPVVALLLLMRQSFALFLEIRETYRTTVEVLVEAAESQDGRRVGHSDRTATVARAIAVNCNLTADQVDRISYAALLHDLGELAAEQTTTGTPLDAPVSRSSAIVHDVEFFHRVEPILKILDGVSDGARDLDDALSALIVALASDIDAEYHDEVAAAHAESAVARVAPFVTPAMKARAVGAALRLGYRIPAVT